MNEWQLRYRDEGKKKKKKRSRVYFKKKFYQSQILSSYKAEERSFHWREKTQKKKGKKKGCIFASVVDRASELNKKLSFMNVKTSVFRCIIRTTTPRSFCLIPVCRYCRQWCHCPVWRLTRHRPNHTDLGSCRKAVQDW